MVKDVNAALQQISFYHNETILFIELPLKYCLDQTFKLKVKEK